jgi:hypothetical protein
MVVKGKNAFRNGLGFQAQIKDLHLKCCIPKENPENNISVTLHRIPPNIPQMGQGTLCPGLQNN